jgi:hypothetical protein
MAPDLPALVKRTTNSMTEPAAAFPGYRQALPLNAAGVQLSGFH